jgi:hypothetical protein
MTTLTGTVLNGVVVLNNGPTLPEGTEVDVTVRPAVEAVSPPTAEEPKGPFAWMLEFAGKLADMPADFAQQHDHYIHGTPKR